jgi:hypothetical protein
LLVIEPQCNQSSDVNHWPKAAHPLAMLADIYIEALLVDEKLADQVWEAWDTGAITNELAAWAWCILAITRTRAPSE